MKATFSPFGSLLISGCSLSAGMQNNIAFGYRAHYTFKKHAPLYYTTTATHTHTLQSNPFRVTDHVLLHFDDQITEPPSPITSNKTPKISISIS